METTKDLTTYVCGCCKRTLSTEAFYRNKKTGCPTNYCKECRKYASQKQRKAGKRNLAHSEEEEKYYPVITQLKDPVVRKELIRQALAKVAESIERKKRKSLEAEYEQ